MDPKLRKMLRKVAYTVLSAGVAASATVSIGFTADSVTGGAPPGESRIRQVDLESAVPVTVINREEIDSSGEISVAEFLRGSIFNSTGSFRQSSGSSAQSQSTLSLRGLGATRTLVLIDGRRIAGSPTVGSGAAQNLNIIPLAAVERIEILRDGASPLYGVDAIGGVVNVLLRHDFEGIGLAAGIGRPVQDGGDEHFVSITGGASSGKGNVSFALDHASQAIVFNADRDFSRLGLSDYGFPGTMWIAGLGRAADPRCPAGIDLDGDGIGDKPDPSAGTDAAGVNLGLSVLRDGSCRYNYAAVSANEASIERDSFFINTNYEINDSIRFFARGTASRTESDGRSAPTPQVGGMPLTPVMSGANPNNPTRPGALLLADFPGFSMANGAGAGLSFPAGATDFSQWEYRVTDDNGTPGDPGDDFDVVHVLDCGLQPGGACDIASIWYRNVAAGLRDTRVDNVWTDTLVGLQGSSGWFGGSDWEVAMHYSRQTNNHTTAGLAIRPLTQAAIDDGRFDIFGVNGPTDPALARSFAHTGLHNEETRMLAGDAWIGFDLIPLANGLVPIALGLDYRDEKFVQDYDALQNGGSIDGSAGGEDISAGRVVYAVYAALAVPVRDNLELGLKLRRDHYNDVGNATTPQISVGWRPRDSLLLRASYGEGFRAPGMEQLYSRSAQSFDDGIDFERCNQLVPGNVVVRGSQPVVIDPLANQACVTTQYQNIQGGDPDLKAEQSKQFGLGAVFSPSDELTLSVDYYDTRLTDEIFILPLNAIFKAEFLGQPAGALVIRRADGLVDFVERQYANIAERKTRGIDFAATYDFSIGDVGEFRANFQAAYIDKMQRRLKPTGSFEPLEQTFVPDYRATLSVDWSRGDLAATMVGNHIDSAVFSDRSANLGSWTTWDLQISYDTAWNGRVVVGARNLLDKDPPTDADGLSHPYYSNRLHDVYGRVPYLRYEQDL